MVELLIVIVVIGVLSAMMMLSSTEAVSSAKAADIISNLRNLKTAVVSWYTDNLDRIVRNGNDYKVKDNDGTTDWFTDKVIKVNNASEIMKYLGNNNSITIQWREGANVGNYIIY
ncbi:MAG: type II secretion system protein [Synergistaceae bacterium]|nr:type II secretion system protein [Synergistaceae bacterium]